MGNKDEKRLLHLLVTNAHNSYDVLYKIKNDIEDVCVLFVAALHSLNKARNAVIVDNTLLHLTYV